MKCPVCGRGNLIKETRDLVYTYRGQATTIRQRGRYCEACHEAIFDASESESYMKTVKAFRAHVDAHLLSPSEVKRIRKRLGLTQRQAGEIFADDVHVFSQYERGKVQQDRATDKLLRLLDRHPELLPELKTDKAA